MKSPVSPNPQTITEQQIPPDIPSSKAQSIPKKRTPFPKYKSTLRGPVPSSSGLKEVSQVYRRRKPFPPQEVSIPEDIETPAIREEALTIRQSIRASTRSQTRSDKGKDKILPESKSVAGGQLANSSKKRRN